MTLVGHWSAQTIKYCAQEYCSSLNLDGSYVFLISELEIVGDIWFDDV